MSKAPSTDPRGASPGPDRAPGRPFSFVLLFLLCWGVALASALSLDRERLGLMAIAGAGGAAVVPWLVGAGASLVSRRRARWAGPAASLVVLAVLAAAEHW